VRGERIKLLPTSSRRKGERQIATVEPIHEMGILLTSVSEPESSESMFTYLMLEFGRGSKVSLLEM
jgi:hypothetical protein